MKAELCQLSKGTKMKVFRRDLLLVNNQSLSPYLVFQEFSLIYENCFNLRDNTIASYIPASSIE